MEQILVYADSLSWGIIPNTRQRLPFAQRWTGVFEQQLLQQGHAVRVIENCLNGRRTVWDDPFKDGRNGNQGLAQVIEMHSPLRLVILLLGSNDFQCTHDHSPWLSGQGMARLVDTIRQAPIEPGMPVPPILMVAPPEMGTPAGPVAHKFAGAELRSRGLSQALTEVAQERQTLFFDAGSVTTCSRVDGIHLDADQHLILGQALAEFVTEQLYTD